MPHGIGLGLDISILSMKLNPLRINLNKKINLVNCGYSDDEAAKKMTSFTLQIKF